MGNLSNIKKVYTDVEWEQREGYYFNELSNIVIPESPTTTDIKKITSQIDSLISEAIMEYAYIRRYFEDLDNKIKCASTGLFANMKSKLTANGGKPTEAEIKSHVTQYLTTNTMYGLAKPLYSLLPDCEARYIFMQEYIRVLENKKAAIITDNSMLKIESNISN